MRLRLRLLWLILSSFWKNPMGLLDESVLNLRALPNDIDISKISNDRFIALMGLGRMDIAFLTGMLKSMFKNKWIPLATFDTIRFRYPLKAFQRYQLRTKTVWWDDTTVYFKQVFERKGRVVATGYVCATFLGPDDPIPPARQSAAKPIEPTIVAKLRELESLIHETQKE